MGTLGQEPASSISLLAILRKILNLVMSRFSRLISFGVNITRRLVELSRIKPEIFPAGSTLVIALALFAVYLGFGAAAIAFPTPNMLIMLWIASGATFVALATTVVRDWRNKGYPSSLLAM